MKCPKCDDAVLHGTVVRGIELDRCESCRGVWFDEDELSKLIKDQGASGRELKGKETGLDSKPGKCPHDGAPLLRVYSKRNRAIVMDHCSACKGVWLDGGEFQRLTE
jgi:Zn-finger nucleic acid-binding protein